MALQQERKFIVPGVGETSALFLSPSKPHWLMVFAHGAGAGMRHAFLQATVEELASAHIATFRYQFPYTEAGRRRPDPPAVLTATVAAAVQAASGELPGVPMLAGGKSMGGRMTSQAAALGQLPTEVRGLVFFGFPLHPPKHPGVKRAEHLENVKIPMLFLQATRDDLADLSLLRPICARLGKRATLHVIEGADHSFHVLKKSGKTDHGVLQELVKTVEDWAAHL